MRPRIVVANSPGWVLGSVAFAAPWFILRIPGTSFSIVDLLLFLSLFVSVAYTVIRSGVRLAVSSRVAALIAVGTAFLFVGVQSAIEGMVVEGIELQFGEFVSVVVQYAFIMIVLPVWALHWLDAGRIWHFLRYTALGYLVPMLVTLFLMNSETHGTFRDLFFSAGRAQGPFGNPNAFSAVLVTVIPIYGALCMVERGWWRIAGMIGLLCALSCLVLTASFGGVLILSVLFGIACVVAATRIKTISRNEVFGIVLSGVFLLVGGALVGSWLSESPWLEGQIINRINVVKRMVDRAPKETDEIGTLSIRISLIEEGANTLAKRHGGMWGHGLGQSHSLSMYGYDVHLLYLQLWVEGGLILAVLYIVFLGFLFRNALQLASIFPVAGITVAFGIIAIALFGLINPHIYLRYYWLPVLPAFVSWRTVRTPT